MLGLTYLQVRQGINHKKVIHGAQIPHRNPTVSTYAVRSYNWWGFPRTEQVQYNQYPLTDSPQNPLDWGELQRRVNDAKRGGLDVELVLLSELEEWAAQGAEDQTQENRGVVDMVNEWQQEQRRRRGSRKERKRNLLEWILPF